MEVVFKAECMQYQMACYLPCQFHLFLIKHLLYTNLEARSPINLIPPKENHQCFKKPHQASSPPKKININSKKINHWCINNNVNSHITPPSQILPPSHQKKNNESDYKKNMCI